MAGTKINCTREMVGVLAPRAGMGQPAPGGEAGSTRCRDTWALPALGLCSEGSEEGPCPATWRPQVRLLEAEAPDLLPVCANPGRTHHPHLHEASLCDVKRSTQKLRKPGRESKWCGPGPCTSGVQLPMSCASGSAYQEHRDHNRKTTSLGLSSSFVTS